MSDQKIPILLNLVAAFFGAGGQYFYKLGGKQIADVPVWRNLPLWLGVLLFIGVMGCFVVGYKMGGRISVVYPFYATTFLWGTLIGVLFEKEPWSWPALGGVALILAGLVLIATQAGRA